MLLERTNNSKRTRSVFRLVVHNWQKEKYMYLRDTKNRKPERVFLDDRAIEILKRLERSRFTDKNAWAVAIQVSISAKKKHR